MKLKALIATVGAFAISIANAGDAGKAPCIEESPIGATISTGYMTSYIFRGVEQGDNAIFTSLDYTLTALPVDVDLGLFYVNPTSGPGNDDQLHLSAAVAGPSVAGFDTAVSFTAFLFPELGGQETYEVAVGASRSLGIVDWSGSAHYDFEREGWYFTTGIEKAIGVLGHDLVISSGISYGSDYWTPGDEFNHVYVQASLPIALSSNVTLEPYVAGLFALDHIEFQDDIVHGGISLSIDF